MLVPTLKLFKTKKQKLYDWPKPPSHIIRKSLGEKRSYEGKDICFGDVLNSSVRKKVNKYIEIVMLPDADFPKAHRYNVGITLHAPTILDTLSQYYEKVHVSVIKTEDDLKDLIEKKPDLIFSGIKYFRFNGQAPEQDIETVSEDSKEQLDDIWFCDYLSDHNLAYIGSTTKAYRDSYNKANAKKNVQNAGIKTAEFFTTQPDELCALKQSLSISFPLFVKMNEGGDSREVDENSIVKNFEELKTKVFDIYKEHQRSSLVETYLSGKEYTVGVFQDIASGNLMAMPIEIIPKKNKNGDRILDYKTKKNDTEKVIEVADPQTHKLLSDFAIQVFKALKATSHARIDIKMDGYGVPHFLEGNLMPGLAKGYFYRSCAINQNMSYEDMLYKISDNAMKHHCQGRAS